MAWVDTLQGGLVGLDTAPLVYFIEANPAYVDRVRPFFQALVREQLRVVTSTVTLLEVLVQPLRRGDTATAGEYREFLLHTGGLTTLPLSARIAEQAADIRARYNVGFPDAVQIATAVNAGAATFLTNDARLSRITDLRVLVLEEIT